MVGKLFLFMISFIGIMASGPALAILAVLIIKPDIDAAVRHYPMVLTVFFGLYGVFVSLMFFHLQDRIFVFTPPWGTTALSKADVVGSLEKSFNTPVEGSRLFDFMAKDNRVVITWSSSVNYFQVTNVGGRGMKRVIVLTLDEKNHEAFFVMKDKDWRWNAAKDFFNFSLNYSTGIFAEYETEVYPSITLSGTGGLKVDMKKLTYSSNELWIPVRAALLSSGWTLRGGMMPKFLYRALFSVMVPGLLFFGMALFCVSLAGSSPPKVITSKMAVTTESQQAYPRTKSADVASQVERTIPHLSAENIQIILEGYMRTPRKYFDAELRETFVVYGNGYFTKPDRREEFSSRIREFARTNKIEGIRE
jgi:hypothetical protein